SVELRSARLKDINTPKGKSLGIWITPKALANFSPRLELATTLGKLFTFPINPERVYDVANPFRVDFPFLICSQGSRERSNPGLKLANAFGVAAPNPTTAPVSNPTVRAAFRP
ncbi:MAG TPA: hypothetical protein VJS13_11825, partial [Pyrinomonadaceae bacterium]|nr:hypothetical protein [Pyrinomonadaceae bacterium]